MNCYHSFLHPPHFPVILHKFWVAAEIRKFLQYIISFDTMEDLRVICTYKINIFNETSLVICAMFSKTVVYDVEIIS